MFCSLAVAFHFSKVKGSVELLVSIHSLLFKSKGKVRCMHHPLAIPGDNLGQRLGRRISHSVWDAQSVCNVESPSERMLMA